MGNEAILLKRKKLKAIQALRSNDLRKARKLLREVCRSDPRDPQAWLLLSSVNGRGGDFEGVIECCQRALLLDARIPQAYGNLGNAHVSLGRHEEAMEAYRKALALSPKDPSILHNLGSALQKMGRVDEAIEYFQQSVFLQPNYAEAHYGLANALHERWRFKDAIPHYQHALRIDPRMRDARIGLARTLNNRGDLHLAEVCLREALEIHTDDLELHLELATTLRYQGRFDDALVVLDKALKIDPKHPSVIAAQADLFERKRDYDKAYALVRQSSAAGEWTTTAADVLIRLCRRLGCCEEAVEIAQRLLAMDSLQVGSRQQLHYSLGRLYDKLGDFDKAFSECKQANDLSGLLFDPVEHAARVDELIAGFNAEAMAKMPRAALRSQQPILIIGMPRSGTSLVEQIVASHPEVFGAGELNDIGELVRALPTGLFPHRIASIGREVVDDLARRYLARLEELGGGAPRVTDKLPGNFLYLGLIDVMLPDARVIHCVRDPMDTCLSIYLQGFSNGHPYATDLMNIAAYYNDYLRLMEHWKGVLDIRMLEVDYRDLVTNQERVSRELIAFCGLEWDDRCLRFHETERAVATASYDQVRKPVYTKSLDRWKNYEQHIGPLREALARSREPSARRVARTQPSRDEDDTEPTERVTAMQRGKVLLRLGRIEEAIDDLRRVIGRNPNDAEGHCELASALEMRGQVEEAISHYDQARRIEPRSRRASLQLGRLLGGMGRFAEAEACYRQALIYTPDGPRLHYGLADALRYEGRYDDALAVFKEVLQRHPENAVAMAGMADLYERKGEYAEAYAWVRRVIDAGAAPATAADVLLRLCRDYDCCDEAVALANQLLTSGSLSQDARRRLHFALGRHYDKVGRFDAAFAEFQLANSLVGHHFDCDKHIEQVDGLIGGFSIEALAKMPRASVRSERPIFIVGMTRSGTSLVEQILSSHRQILGGGELHEINAIVQSLPATLYPLCMDSVSQETIDALAKRYLGRLNVLSGEAARVADKMPGNFQNLGLIAITLPGARVIRCLRDPLDTCLSTYFQDFGPSHPYASDLRNIGVFYKEYERLMAHWIEVLDIPILEVRYRELVADQERVSREMIEFCGLEWDDHCLLFHETKRSVATASYDQVRRPMYETSIERWRNYEKHLEPLRRALEEEDATETHGKGSQACRDAVEAGPNDPQAAYHQGVALCQAGKHQEAMACFELAIHHQPFHAEAHAGMASACIALGRFDKAFVHCTRALSLDSEAQQFWLTLGMLFSDARNEMAWEQAARLDADLVDRWLHHASRICASQEEGARGENDELTVEAGSAVFCMCQGMALALMYKGRLDDAFWAGEQALRLKPGNPVVLAGQAGILERRGDVAGAYKRVRAVLDGGVVSLGTADVYTRICMQAGDCDEAIEVCRWLLAKNSLPSQQRQLLFFALGKLYDKLGDYDNAFREFERANRLSASVFDRQGHAKWVDALTAGFGRRIFPAIPRASVRSERPVFVLGMPRSGTSLVEQILASHPLVFGAGELNAMNELVQSFPTTLYPGRIGSITKEMVDMLAKQYLDHLNGLNKAAKRVTDKMPGNFRHLGLIAIMFPGARVIHCVRDPLDTCISIYFQNLGTSHPYANDLGNIGAFYKEYRRLMAHWREVLDIAMLELQYSDLVTDQERISRDMIAFCGLEWDDRCLLFHETKRSVTTASYHQVRRPMYSSSLGRWKNYEAHIGPLRDALGPVE